VISIRTSRKRESQWTVRGLTTTIVLRAI